VAGVLPPGHALLQAPAVHFGMTLPLVVQQLTTSFKPALYLHTT
jgi:hypothetical protein